MDIKKDSPLWKYISDHQKDLILQGQYLISSNFKAQMSNETQSSEHKFFDYSFVVFPFAKAYEGFLKQIFLDVKFISHLDYISDHFRLGKVMSPNLVGRLGDRSVFRKICNSAGQDLADKIWNTWKAGRNQVFHYFPHNLRSLTFAQAEQISSEIIDTMEETMEKLTPIKSGLNVEKIKNKLASLS